MWHKMKLVAHVTFLALVPLMARGGGLMPCPDCGREVSKRALMCPNCGLKGEVIAQVAKELETKPKPKIPDSWVRADFGGEVCRAMPVTLADGKFVVLPLEKTFGMETLLFTYASTNTTIAYGVPEVALDQPLIRFPISATNLLFGKIELSRSERDFILDAAAEKLRVRVLKDEPDPTMKRLGKLRVRKRLARDRRPVEFVDAARRKN